MPLHIRAQPGDVAPIALLAGDPGRAVLIAGALDAARCYNENRGLLGFTGAHHGRPVSVQTTGMGGPSAAIVVEELADLGVETLIRLGTCGAIAPSVAVLDFVIASAAVGADGTTRHYSGKADFTPAADAAVTRALVAAGAALSGAVHVGYLVTQDAFYRQPASWGQWRRRGVLAVEMEAAAIFTVALGRGLRAGAACLVVDRVNDRASWASDDAIASATTGLIALGLGAVERLG